MTTARIAGETAEMIAKTKTLITALTLDTLSVDACSISPLCRHYLQPKLQVISNS